MENRKIPQKYSVQPVKYSFINLSATEFIAQKQKEIEQVISAFRADCVSPLREAIKNAQKLTQAFPELTHNRKFQDSLKTCIANLETIEPIQSPNLPNLYYVLNKRLIEYELKALINYNRDLLNNKGVADNRLVEQEHALQIEFNALNSGHENSVDYEKKLEGRYTSKQYREVLNEYLGEVKERYFSISALRESGSINGFLDNIAMNALDSLNKLRSQIPLQAGNSRGQSNTQSIYSSLGSSPPQSESSLSFTFPDDDSAVSTPSNNAEASRTPEPTSNRRMSESSLSHTFPDMDSADPNADEAESQRAPESTSTRRMP